MSVIMEKIGEVEKIGDMCEVKGELIIEWKIKEFSSISEKKYIRYSSPNFYFAGASWCLWFYPNSDCEESDGYVSIYLMRRSWGSPVNVSFTFGLETSDGKICPDKSGKRLFDNHHGCGYPTFLPRSTLMEKMSELDELTISCSVRSTDRNDISESFFHRLQLVSLNLRDIYKSGKRTDVVLKVEGENLHAHRMILQTQSPVFEAMFNHDTIENQTGEVSIKDIEKSTVHVILDYLYSGEIEMLTTENVLSIFVAAEKYDIKEVKNMCLKFILRNLTGDWLCDIIRFAHMNNEEEVGRRAKEYFTENVKDILASHGWKAFVAESPDIVLKFLV